MTREPQEDLAWSYMLGQFANKPRLEALTRAYFTPNTILVRALDRAYTSLDLDAAFGEHLDYIGSIVGASREFPNGMFMAYFGFESQPAGRAFGKARMRRDGESITTVYSAGDAEFKTLIRLKILMNNARGTAPEIIEAVRSVFMSRSLPVEIQQIGLASALVRIGSIPSVDDPTPQLLEERVPRAGGVDLTFEYYDGSGLYDFSAGIMDPRSDLTRASTATRINHRGYIEEVAVNEPRFTYDPALTYNMVPNPWGDGSPPTGWAVGASDGITPVYLSSGVRNGVPYSRWRVQGTATGGGFPNIKTMAYTDTRAVQGDTFAAQAHFEIIRVGAGNTSNAPNVVNLSIAGYTDAGAQTEAAGIQIVPGAKLSDPPVCVNRTMSAATTTNVVLRATIPNNIGEVHDWDFDIGFPILNKGLTYLADTVPFATLASRVNGIPQYGIRGLLTEPPSTNQNANPRAEGAVAGVLGSGGALPTGWAGPAAATPVTATVVGVQSRRGVAGLVLRFAGVPTGTGAVTIRTGSEDTVEIGTTVANRAYVELLGGTMTNVSSWQMRASGTEAGGDTSFTPGAFAEIKNIRTLVGTLSGTTLRWNYTNTTDPVDFTIWIGWPTREHAPFVSTPVLPPVGTLAPATRAAEVLTLPDVSDGNYKVKIRAGSNTEYTNLGVAATGGTGLNVAWTAEAVAANESVVKSVVISPNI